MYNFWFLKLQKNPWRTKEKGDVSGKLISNADFRSPAYRFLQLTRFRETLRFAYLSGSMLDKITKYDNLRIKEFKSINQNSD